MFKNYTAQKKAGTIKINMETLEKAKRDHKAQITISCTFYDPMTGDGRLMEHKYTLDDLRRQRDTLQTKVDGINALLLDIGGEK